MKTCTGCSINKELDCFEKEHSSKGGVRAKCKQCRNKQKKLNYDKRNYSPDLTITNKKCYDCQQIKVINEFYTCNRFKDGFHPTCRDCSSIKSKQNYNKSSDKIKKDANEYYYANKEKVMKNQLKRQKERLATDPSYKLRRNLRNRLYYALKNKGWKKDTHFNKYIGCDYPTLITHLESKFTPEMNWENHGSYFEIDHIYPLSLAETQEEMYKLCHYTNLQPLVIQDNRKKSNKIN